MMYQGFNFDFFNSFEIEQHIMIYKERINLIIICLFAVSDYQQ